MSARRPEDADRFDADRFDADWFEAGARHRRAILERLLDREWAYVPITALLRESASPLRGRPFRLFATRRGAAIGDVVVRARDGLLLAAFGERKAQRATHEREGRELRGVIGAEAAPHSSMGLTTEVRRLETLLGLRPRVYVDHVLMTLDRGALPAQGAASADGGPARAVPDAALPDGVVTRRARVRDTARLLALREAYELEEVVLDGSRFDRHGCRRRLRRSLRNELVYVAEHRGRPVATAATNTRGVRVDQVGGVFTTPSRRRTGLGTTVMLALLRGIFRDKEQACLFVKTGNAAALRLYERLGFAARGGYRISYYR